MPAAASERTEWVRAPLRALAAVAPDEGIPGISGEEVENNGYPWCQRRG